MSDNVKHPSHYCKGGIECIDAIKSAVSDITDPFEAYCTGNIIKYIWRWNDKNGIEDLHKAMQYIDFIEQYRANSHTPTVTTNAHKPTQAEYEELFAPDINVATKSEPVKGEYDGLSNRELRELVCGNLDWNDCNSICPLTVAGFHTKCHELTETELQKFRKDMISFVNKREVLGGKHE